MNGTTAVEAGVGHRTLRSVVDAWRRQWHQLAGPAGPFFTSGKTTHSSTIFHSPSILEHQFYNACYAVDAITILEKRVMDSSLMHITVLLQDAPKDPTNRTNLLKISMLT